jgi:hypothetical protein
MYYTSVPNYNQSGGHNHKLQINDLPSHEHSMIGGSNMGLVFEKDDFVINMDSGVMINIKSNETINCNDIFLDNICDCVVSRFTNHDINLFKVGNSNELKEMILNFLKKETE